MKMRRCCLKRWRKRRATRGSEWRCGAEATHIKCRCTKQKTTKGQGGRLRRPSASHSKDRTTTRPEWLKPTSRKEQGFCPFSRRYAWVAASVQAMAAPRSHKAQRAVSGSGSSGTQWGRRTKNQLLGPALAAVLLVALVDSCTPRALQNRPKKGSVRLEAQSSCGVRRRQLQVKHEVRFARKGAVGTG
jgi:hypothetical protein